MVSKYRLDKPCPCGSGDKYRHCCAPQNHRKKRRRSKKSNSPPPTHSDTGPTDPPPVFVERVNAFIEHFAKTFNATYDKLETLTDGFYIDDALKLVEMPPWNHVMNHARLMLLHSWLLAGQIDELYENLTRDELIDQCSDLDSAAADDALSVLDAARLGAWKLTVENNALTANPIDGRPDSEPVVVDSALDNNWNDVAPGSTYVGWLADLDVGTLLFFAHELPAYTVDTLENIAGRSGWGDGDNFRRRDYERDMLALALNPEAADTGLDDGPLLISPNAAEYADQFRHDILHLVSEEVFYEHYEDFYGYRSDLQLTAWTQRAARAIDDGFSELLEQLRDEFEQCAYGLRDFPFAGPDTLAALIDDADLTSIAHLQPDGTVDHPPPRHHRLYPVGVLDVEPDWLRRHSIGADATVDQALGRAQTRLDDQALQKLTRAIHDLRIASRWAGIVALNRDADDAVIPRVNYQDLRTGIDDLLPRWVGDTPVEDLADPGRGTWPRITKALRNTGELADDEPMTISDIAHDPNEMMALPGVAEGTARNIYLALYDYVATWPESAGFKLPHPDPDAAAEGLDDIAAGLDELDELF